MVKKRLEYVYIIKENEELLKTRATWGLIWAIGAKQNFLQKNCIILNCVLNLKNILVKN